MADTNGMAGEYHAGLPGSQSAPPRLEAPVIVVFSHQLTPHEGVPQSDQPRTSVPVALEDYFKPHANNRRGRPPIARRAGNRQQRRRDASHQYYRGDGSSRSRQQTPVPVPVAEQFESNIIVPFAIPVARGLLDHPRVSAFCISDTPQS